MKSNDTTAGTHLVDETLSRLCSRTMIEQLVQDTNLAFSRDQLHPLRMVVP